MTLPSARALSATAFGTLVLIAFMMGANHVAARVAFDHGVSVGTAVMVRSATTALALALLLWLLRIPVAFSPAQRKALLAIGVLIAVQSACLYSSVARLPVALALLAFNTYPLFAVLWSALIYRQPPQRRVLAAMPVMLVGLALALDVFGTASGLGTSGQWALIGEGVAYALIAAATFGLALVLTQQEAAEIDGRVRSFVTMAQVGLLAAVAATLEGSFQWPRDAVGWQALAALSCLYGTAFTILFTVLPRLGAVGNSAIMNVEPVFALLLAWALLGQHIAVIQLFGALVVVGTVVWLGLRRA